MGRIYSLTISREGGIKLDETTNIPSKAVPKGDDANYQKAPDKISYSGSSDACISRIAKRFGKKFQVDMRDSCKTSSDERWAIASTHVKAAMHIVSGWLANHQKFVEEMHGVPVHQFDGGELHGVVKVTYTTNKDGKITALDFTSEKSGFQAHVEDLAMFPYLWSQTISVSKK